MSREGFTNAIIGGAETLIRSAIKSVNYIMGVSGWRITRDGDAEFNDATIRGTVIAGNGTVTLNNLGVFVIDDNSTQQYVILRDGGFVARNFPDDGQHNQMWVNGLAISAPTVSSHGFASTDARFDASQVSVALVDFMQANMVTGTINGQDDANLLLRSEGSDGVSKPLAILDTAGGQIQLNSAITFVQHRLVSTNTGMDYAASQCFIVSFNLTAGGTGLALGATNYPVAFPVGAVLFGHANIKDGSGNVRGWVPQWLNVSNTQFNMVVRNALAGGGPAALTVDINVTVFIIPA